MTKSTLIQQDEFEASIQGNKENERGEYNFLNVQPRLQENWGGLWLEILEEKQSEAQELDWYIEDELFCLRALKDLNSINFSGFLKEQPSPLLLNIYYASDRCYYGYANIYRKIKELAAYLKDCRFFISEDYSNWLDEYRIIDGVLHFTRQEYPLDDEHFTKFFTEKAEENQNDSDLCYAVATDLIFSIHYDFKYGKVSNKHEMKVLDQALKLCPVHEQALLLKGFGLMSRKKINEAKKNFHSILSINPNYTQALLGLGLVALIQKQYEQGLDYFKKAEKTLPDEKTLWLLQLLCYGPLNHPDYIHGLLNKLCQPPPDSHYTLAFFTMINGASLLNDLLIQILPQLQGYIKKNPDKIESLSLELNLLLKTLIRFDECKDALKHFLVWMLEIQDHNAVAAYELSKLTPDQEEKRKLLKKTIESDPRHKDALSTLAVSYYNDKLYEDAIVYLEMYLKVVDTGYFLSRYRGMLARSYYARALELEQEKVDLEKADSYYEKAMELCPLVPDLAHFEGPWVGRGHVAVRMKEYEKALPYYDMALEKNKNSVYAWSGKAVALADLNQYEAALDCANTAYECDANYWHVYYAKAYILALKSALNSKEEILNLLKKANDLYPKFYKVIADEPAFECLKGEEVFKKIVKPK